MKGESQKGPPPVEFDYVDSAGSLEKLLDDVGGSDCERCAIDTEADSLHCYEEKLCLIQFAAADRFAIVDPLAIEDLGPLTSFLDSTEVWMHGADFDMRMLRRASGCIPRNVFDTQTASRLLGVRRFGLANLVEDHFGVVLPKGSQKADWGQRPLPPKMLDYAVNDVRYLLEMAETLVGKLRDLDRWEWFTESCDAARLSAAQRREKDPDMVWRITGWGKLQRRGMGYLRELWRWRDGEAKRRDRPAFKIIGNEHLLGFARELQEGRRVSLPKRFPGGPVRRFRAAIATARAIPDDELPEGPKRVRGKRNPDAEKRCESLRAVRDRSAESHGIDPTLIASRATLERVAAVPHEVDACLLKWQQALLEPKLGEYLDTIGD